MKDLLDRNSTATHISPEPINVTTLATDEANAVTITFPQREYIIKIIADQQHDFDIKQYVQQTAARSGITLHNQRTAVRTSKHRNYAAVTVFADIDNEPQLTAFVRALQANTAVRMVL